MNLQLLSLLIAAHAVTTHIATKPTQRPDLAHNTCVRTAIFFAASLPLAELVATATAIFAGLATTVVHHFATQAPTQHAGNKVDSPHRPTRSIPQHVAWSAGPFVILALLTSLVEPAQNPDRKLILTADLAVMGAAAIFAWRGGAAFTAKVLETVGMDQASEATSSETADAPPLGRVIGVLERLLIVTLVLVDAWAGIGLILAAKSIARFKELENRRFGEYYLVGTLTSVLVAILIGLGARTLIAGSGIGWLPR